MATPNASHPVSLRPGVSPPLDPTERHYRSQESETLNSLRDYSPQPTSQRDTLADSLEKVSSTSDFTSYTDMSAQQPGQQYSYNPRFPSAQFQPSSSAQGDLSTDNGWGAGEASRIRPANYNVNYGNSEIQPLPQPNQQQLFAQHSGALGAESSSQAGPSNLRPTSARNTDTPIASSFHSSATSQVPSTASPRPSTASKSPFTTPITSPPRSRPNQVLLVNPTSTTGLTNLLLNTLRPILPHALEVTAYGAPYPAPTAIESIVDSVLSSETALRDLAKYSTNNGETIQNYDALLVASYSKHPLIDALRESYDVPVVGIMEASLYVARMLGGRFGILSTSTRMKYQIDDAVNAYGLDHFFVGIESLHISPLDLLGSPFAPANTSADSVSSPSTPSTSSKYRDEVQKRLAIQSKALVAKGADTIILGCEFLSSIEVIRTVKDAIRDEDGRRTVNVIDSVEAGIMMINGLVGMGVPTSKKGIFRGEREGRRGRGQNWL